MQDTINNIAGAAITAVIVIEMAATGLLLISMWVKSMAHVIRFFHNRK